MLFVKKSIPCEICLEIKFSSILILKVAKEAKVAAAEAQVVMVGQVVSVGKLIRNGGEVVTALPVVRIEVGRNYNYILL